jgi:hypothetical protein
MAQPFPPGLTVPLTVGTDVWRMNVHGAVCRDDKWVIDVVLVGPRTHTLSISTHAPEEPEIAAQTVISLVRAWLSSGDSKNI